MENSSGDKKIIRISVRNLVEFILRSGDLDSRGGGIDKEAMLKGSRIHRRIQKQMGSGYRAEAALKELTEFEDLSVQVEGRADGIFEEEGLTWIDEIKGLHAGLEHLEAPVPVHRAQAFCYGYIYGKQQKLDRIGIQMTYADLETEKIRRFRETISMEELCAWYEKLLLEYHKWVSFREAWIRLRDRSMQGLEFPFPYRKGQRKMVTGVYHTISEGRQIFVQAPTGVGKTMSAVYPAVRSVGEGKADTVFYLTAKTITRTVAEEAYQILRSHGLRFKTITITAKEKVCFLDKPECDPEHCPYAKGHFDRVNDAVFELLQEEVSYDRETLLAHAEKWRVCPFEMCLDLAVWTDGVICDYNYVFDPNVYLKRYFGEGVSGRYIFLVDEAHNLVERSREMYSASIDRTEVLLARRLTKNRAKRLYRALGRVNTQLLELEKETEEIRVLENPGALPLTLLEVQGEIERLLSDQADQEIVEEILDFYFSVRDFLNIADLLDENYVVYFEKAEDGRGREKLYCVNPAANLSERLKKGAGTVFFSATLLPMGYYRRLLSIRDDDYGIYVASPFPQENRCILTGVDVSTRYKRRGYEEYRKIAEYIARAVWQKRGNYMVFFPSYRMMEDVRDIYEQEFAVPWVQTLIQQQDMNEQEREGFLERFSEQEGTLVGFCIMGGIFAEGIDLIGDRLIGAIIVGTGLPQVSRERELLSSYYNKKGGQGFHYAYLCPGMNKVLQAAGRVIRSRTDVGMILLLDERFCSPEYAGYLPEEWNDRQICRLDTVEARLKEFWDHAAKEASETDTK
ncbi:MAG: ATP-dependent DNA helicase [Blautia sp.]|nr:ATP-dependent DNA helicase [Blautia sp.]